MQVYNLFHSLWARSSTDNFLDLSHLHTQKVYQYRLKSGFSKRLVFCKATIEPSYPLPEEHNILRQSKSNDYVCLEGDGLLGVMLKLQISDKKTLGAKTKGRQFSVLYKVDCQNFKEVLNTAFSNGFISPVSGNETYKIGNIKQKFQGYFNSIPLEVTLTRDELGPAFTTKGDDFLKILSYKFFKAYLDYCDKQVTNVALQDQAKQSMVKIDSTNLGNSENLYLVKPFSNIFGPSTKSNEAVSTVFSEKEKDSKGRLKPMDETVAQTAPAYSVTDEFFNGFSLLPLSLNLVERESNDYLSFEKKIETIKGFTVDNSILDDFLTTKKNRKHTLIVENRLTTYEVLVGSETSDPSQGPPMIFSYFEDGTAFERAYVNTDFLGACLHKVLFQHIQQLHGSRVIYNSLKFSSYEKKTWLNRGLYCRKGSLQQFSSKETPFRLIQVGRNPLDIVNFRTNLLFTAEFPEMTGNFYKTNRFITCSAFTSQNEVADLQYQELFETLEKAFGETIVLSDIPTVTLLPAFERGTIVQTSNKIYFKGLVSNASAMPESF